MEFWFEAEIRTRRDSALETARRIRLVRLARKGRSSGVRAHIADGALALSERLAMLARAMRASERV